MDEGDIVTSSAYILFYQRRGVPMGNLDYNKIRNSLEAVSQEARSPGQPRVETGGT